MTRTTFKNQQLFWSGKLRNNMAEDMRIIFNYENAIYEWHFTNSVVTNREFLFSLLKSAQKKEVEIDTMILNGVSLTHNKTIRLLQYLLYSGN